ncbi:cyclopropane-fatty-acyl-phospholipid synthase [Catenovulum agarivorans DS-2]|uniref:Cyclopropane-fatty-acyl-phospholipid synthase n=1 Tax=Catenovulum agarivorans DS-2 TaxID=1328313 RepID=W7QNC0_9ALTE|nr:cyclopropane-fatty-acyl-phospholipid synthase family protein [Catenovulum agarivorans]EWH09403.1 cyclopropane-fatty-acyl-phospholipid synthase [Catenovulum agarivorans DS-2]
MERAHNLNIKNDSLTGLAGLSWFNVKCRKLVMDSLNKMQAAGLVIEEGAERICLGNQSSDLVASIRILDATCYIDFVTGGSIGASEAFIDHKWTTADLTKVIQVFARCQQELDEIEGQSSLLNKLQNKLLSWKNANTKAGSKRNILAHYDLGNDLYTRFLDDKMMYSAAIYPSAETSLAEAQNIKLKTICDKLALTESDHLIEIGTGWGGLAIFAAQNYGCKVTTTTISDAQYEYACAKVEQLGLSQQITLLKQDYRLLQGQFDKLVSIEMIEAVGHEFLPTFFKKCNSLVKPKGKMLLQAITIADQRYDHYRKNVDFIQKYIFPGGCLPSVSVIAEQFAKSTNMVIDNVQDIGLDYAKTLADWRNNFEDNWQEIEQFGFDNKFKRLWVYYLSYCEGAFLQRVISTHHIVANQRGF